MILSFFTLGLPAHLSLTLQVSDWLWLTTDSPAAMLLMATQAKALKSKHVATGLAEGRLRTLDGRFSVVDGSPETFFVETGRWTELLEAEPMVKAAWEAEGGGAAGPSLNDPLVGERILPLLRPYGGPYRVGDLPHALKNMEISGIKGFGAIVHPVTARLIPSGPGHVVFAVARLFAGDLDLRDILRSFCPVDEVIATLPGEVVHRMLVKPMIAELVINNLNVFLHALWAVNVAEGSQSGAVPPSRTG